MEREREKEMKVTVHYSMVTAMSCAIAMHTACFKTETTLQKIITRIPKQILFFDPFFTISSSWKDDPSANVWF